jgi:hypothetical protein
MQVLNYHSGAGFIVHRNGWNSRQRVGNCNHRKGRVCQALRERGVGWHADYQAIDSTIYQLIEDSVRRIAMKDAMEQKVLFDLLASLLQPADHLGKEGQPDVHKTESGIEADDVGAP